jgi:hypothetical protein
MDIEDDTMSVKALKTKKGDGDDDTVERLLKLRKTLSKVVPPPVDGEERSQQQDGQEPRSRVDSGARLLSRNECSRPQSRNTNIDDEQRLPATMHRPFSKNTAVTYDQSSFKTASERPSHATSDRTRVDSLSVSRLVGAWDRKEEKKKRKETKPNNDNNNDKGEDAKPAKKSAEEKEKNIFKREDSGWELPKWMPALPTANTFGQAQPGGEKKLRPTTTPPESPAPVRVQLIREESTK